MSGSPGLLDAERLFDWMRRNPGQPMPSRTVRSKPPKPELEGQLSFDDVTDDESLG
jgi:hypothetical protein